MTRKAGSCSRARSWTTPFRAQAISCPFTTEISEVLSPNNPLGVRAGGEGGTTPALAVVVNAIVDALKEFGVKHMEMPVTPERVWRATSGKPASFGR